MGKINCFLGVVLVGSLSILGGCREDKPAEVVQTVDWYKEHEAERTEVLKKCNNNPAELAATANCINASRAKESLTWSSRGGGIKPVKPLTFN